MCQATQITLKNGKQVLRRTTRGGPYSERPPFRYGMQPPPGMAGPDAMAMAYSMGYQQMGMTQHGMMPSSGYPGMYGKHDAPVKMEGLDSSMAMGPGAHMQGQSYPGHGASGAGWPGREGVADILLMETGLTPRKAQLDLPTGFSPQLEDLGLMATPTPLRGPGINHARSTFDHLASPSKLLWGGHAPLPTDNSMLTPGRMEWSFASPLGLPDWDVGSPVVPLRGASTPMKGLPRFDA